MTQAARTSDELYPPDLPVGEILRRAREHYGQSLQDIERALHIRASQIEAIETNHAENLPGRVYAIGFVRSYAEYLGLNADQIVHMFKAQSGKQTHNPTLHFPVPASEGKLPAPWIIGVCAFVAVVLITGAWSASTSRPDIVTAVPDVPPELQEKAALDDIATDTQGNTEEMGPVQPSPDQDRVILNIVENTWVEIKDQQGKTYVSRVLNKGDQYYVPERQDLILSLGNAGGVEIVYNNETLSTLGEAGQVKRNIPLDFNYLIEHYAPAQSGNAEE